MVVSSRDSAERTPSIAVSNLRKTYGADEGEIVAVDGVSFSVGRGSVVGLLGPNGAGKTTTIKMILNLIAPTAGEVAVNGVDPRERPDAMYQDVSALLEGARNCYWQLTLMDNLHFFAGLRGHSLDEHREEAEALLELLDLSDRADEPIQNFSRGMKQKAAFACALIQDPSILFLDEPTLGLDVEADRKLRKMISELADEDRTIVISSHNMDLIEDICDRAMIMMDGRIIADDAIEDLVHIFDTDRYRLTVSEGLSSKRRTVLERRFRARNFSETGTGESFDVLLEGDLEMYELFDTLRDADVAVSDIDSYGEDLEEAFVKAIRDQPNARRSDLVR